MLLFYWQCKYNNYCSKNQTKKKPNLIRHTRDFQGLTIQQAEPAFFILDFSQARSSVPPKIPLMNLLLIRKLNPWVVVDSSLCSCLFPWIWCKCLLRNFIHSKIFNLTNCRQVFVKYSLLITHAGMPRIWMWH